MTLEALRQAAMHVRARFSQPRCHGAYPLEIVRTDGVEATLMVLMSGYGLLEHDHTRVRFDATGEASGVVAVPLRVETGTVVTVRVRGLVDQTAYRFKVTASAPAVRVPKVTPVREPLIRPAHALAMRVAPLSAPLYPPRLRTLCREAVLPPLAPNGVRLFALRVVRERISVQ